MVNHMVVARVFLIVLGVAGTYVAVSDVSPTEVASIPCVFSVATDIPCPGCGMTRACLSLTHGRIADAWRYHPFSLLIVGLAFGIALFPGRFENLWGSFSPGKRDGICIGGIVLCLAAWIFKLWA